MIRWMVGWMDGWTDGWMDVWMEEDRMDGWREAVWTDG